MLVFDVIMEVDVQYNTVFKDKEDKVARSNTSSFLECVCLFFLPSLLARELRIRDGYVVFDNN